MLSLIEAFASSPMLLNAEQRSLEAPANETKDDRAVYFDFLSLFMVYMT